jgi:hypothetical protein
MRLDTRFKGKVRSAGEAFLGLGMPQQIAAEISVPEDEDRVGEKRAVSSPLSKHTPG